MRFALAFLLAVGCREHHHGTMPHRFEKASDWAPIFDDPKRDEWQKPAEVVALAAIEPGMTVVDLGAGTGYFVAHLLRAVGPEGRVLALDVEPDLVRHMRERFAAEKNVTAVEIPSDDPKLADGQAHRVLIVDTWHHIGGRAAYVGKLARGLAPGGRVIVVDFTMETDKGPPRHHRIPAEKVVEELRAGGLDAVVAEETLPDQYVVIATRK